MRGYRKEAEKDLILRNAWTKKSIRFEQTKTLSINQQVARAGSVAPYMETQEFGGTKTARGKHGVPIPTSYSTGEGENAVPRRKLPRKPNKLYPRASSQIRLAKSKRRPINPKQAILFKVQDAVKTGNRVFYHKFPTGSKGLFRVVGGRKTFKRGWPNGADLKMIWGMNKRSVQINKEPMLGPAHSAAAERLPEDYRKALEFQLKRFGLFKNR